MAELSYDSQDIRQSAARSSGSGIFLDLVSGFFEPASARGDVTIIPGLAGVVDRVRVGHTKKILLVGYVRGTSASDWNSKTATLMGKMVPYNAAANLVVADSYLGTTGTHTISARVMNIVPGPIVAQRFQTWSIELESIARVWTVT